MSEDETPEDIESWTRSVEALDGLREELRLQFERGASLGPAQQEIVAHNQVVLLGIERAYEDARHGAHIAEAMERHGVALADFKQLF
jgi:hypothetical protein